MYHTIIIKYVKYDTLVIDCYVAINYDTLVDCYGSYYVDGYAIII